MALSIPCPQSIQDCVCTDDPISNYSSENPDEPVFFGHFNTPPVIGTYFAPGCLAICESTESQQAADDCAAAQAMECSLDGAPEDGNPLWSPTRQKFGNTQQECEDECPDSTCPQTYTVAPGTVISATQADANARAESLACQRAEDKLICFLTSSPLPQGNVDSVYVAQIVTFGGTTTPVFSIVAGALPTGLSLNASTGFITGTPTASATFAFTVRLTTPVATCDKAYSIEVVASCDSLSTDWCESPGACRPRIKDFIAGEWAYFWNGEFPDKATNPFFDCGGGYSDLAGFAGLNYSTAQSRWRFSILCPDLTVYLAAGPVGPASTSLLGVYTFDPSSGPTCTGPASFEVEAYTP